MSNKASPTWDLFLSSLIPQVLLPGERIWKRKQWVVPLILPKHTENWVSLPLETEGGLPTTLLTAVSLLYIC